MNIYFSENIKRFRKERDLTQEALADYLGVSFQTISKWERGESYPDIAFLPVIAEFFSVSTDTLLGVDKAKNEEEIKAILEKYDNGKYKGTDGAFGFMTQAYKKFPNDYRIAVRYMLLLINDIDFKSEPDKHKKEILGIFNRIQNCCINDRIRMRAKFNIIHYYTLLVEHGIDSNITMDDIKEIIDTMPRIDDTKEMLLSYIPFTKEELQSGLRKLIEELLLIMDHSINRYTLYKFRVGDEFSDDDLLNAIEGIEMMNNIYDMFYPDGNYGINWRYVIYNYGNLGDFYHRTGNDKMAYEKLKKCAELSKSFDNMPNITERHGLFFEGQTLNKQEEVNVKLDTNVCMQMTDHMYNIFKLSDEFKATPEFKEIIDIMK